MKLILPFPPSVNTYWRHPNKGAFAGKSLISAAGRKFQSAACAAIVEQLRRLPKPTSNQEVATMLGYRSVNAAVEHLRALEKKGVITIKRGVARGITLHTAMKDDDSEAVGIIRALLAGEENARLRATHWLHERGLKV
ncbi:hypothetical protein GUB09_25100 [Escherichia coli]|nr:hypothetical protein [Escherichia coli]